MRKRSSIERPDFNTKVLELLGLVPLLVHLVGVTFPRL